MLGQTAQTNGTEKLSVPNTKVVAVTHVLGRRQGERSGKKHSLCLSWPRPVTRDSMPSDAQFSCLCEWIATSVTYCAECRFGTTRSVCCCGKSCSRISGLSRSLLPLLSGSLLLLGRFRSWYKRPVGGSVDFGTAPSSVALVSFAE